MRSLIAVAGLALIGAATVASAEDGAPAANTAFRPGWYVAPMGTYFKPSGKRCGQDNGKGAVLALGNRGDFGAIELWADTLSAPFDCSYLVPAPTPTDPNATATVHEADDLKLTGGGLGVVIGPFFEQEFLSRFFGLVALGVQTDKHVAKPLHDTKSITGDAGIGYLQPFRLFDRDLSARVEVRYRYDFMQPPQPGGTPSSFGDILVNLGVQVPLSGPEEPAPAKAEPVAVVPTAVGDADNDGVPDDKDQCPGTPPDSLVNNVGCVPPPPPVVAAPAVTEPDQGEVTLETAKAGDVVVLKGVHFETAKAVLTTDSEGLLDDVAKQMQARPELKVEVGGHTDAQGSDAYNQDLSQRRADAVRDYLAAQGVAPERMTAVGYGESKPVDSNDTKAGRARNRRVELKVLE